MKLFGVKEKVAEKASFMLDARRPKVAAKVSNTSVAYGTLGPTQSRSSFQPSEYNLGEISKVMDIESYVRQAFNKHVELCLKEGYDISSRDEKATSYIKRRLKEMADVSGVTFDMLLRSIATNLVAYSNAFITKVRDSEKSSGSSIRKTAEESLPPVAAYFPMDPTSIQIKRDYHGRVLKYLQRVPGNPIMPQFLPENIVHFHYNKKEGFAFGTPYVVPVLDDIRSLRRLEENVEMLISQNLFPLYQYIVGTENSPAEIYEDGTTEVDVVKNQIERMPTEGSIVTPERHDIKVLGADGKAMDAEKYLKYFEKRVLAGLGMSDVALGRGDTSNRATAATLDKVMTDRCKDYQDVIESFVNEYMFKELLNEGGFIVDEKEDTFVKLKFREIDIDSMLKIQNHAVFKYEHHAISETEMREELTMDPVMDSQRENMYFDIISKPTMKLEAEIKEAGAKDTNNRQKPANQHGSKPAKTSQKKDYSEITAMADSEWNLLRNAVVTVVSSPDVGASVTLGDLKPLADECYGRIMSKSAGYKINKEMFDSCVKDSISDMGDLVVKNASSMTHPGNAASIVSGVFETLRFRIIDMCEKVVLK